MDATASSLHGLQQSDLFLFGTTLVTAVVAVVNAKVSRQTEEGLQTDYNVMYGSREAVMLLKGVIH